MSILILLFGHLPDDFVLLLSRAGRAVLLVQGRQEKKLSDFTEKDLNRTKNEIYAPKAVFFQLRGTFRVLKQHKFCISFCSYLSSFSPERPCDAVCFSLLFKKFG